MFTQNSEPQNSQPMRPNSLQSQANPPISAMFDDYAKAKSAVGRLEVLGVPAVDISVVGTEPSARPPETPIHSDTDRAVAHTSREGVGAVTGGVVGGAAGVLTGIGVLAIPGLGPVVATGWLVSALVGAAAGASFGAMIGGMTSTGIPEDHAHIYAEGIRRGATLVTARVEPRLVAKATEILEAEGRIDIHAWAATWRDEGSIGGHPGLKC